jgi:ribonuclease Z
MDYKFYWESVDPYKIPGTQLTIKGHSIAALKTGFYIPELKMMLDCGVPSNFIPNYIFITHGHADHSLNLPMSFVELNNKNNEYDKKVQIYLPTEITKMAYNSIHHFYIFSTSNPNHTRIHSKYKLNGVSDGDRLELEIKKKKIVVDIIKCDHTVPTVGYCFSEIRKKLKDEFIGLPGREIGEIRKSGIEINRSIEYPLFCYICDTTTKVLETYAGIIQKHKNIFIECSYLYDEHEKLVDENKHVHWKRLMPYVKKYSDKLFILFHFSKRYTNDQIRKFFNNEFKKQSIDNVKLWIPSLPQISST